MHRLLRRPGLSLALAALIGPSVLSAQNDAAQALPLIGSASGGTAFTRQCPPGQILTGIRARIGLVIDAIGIKCRPVNANGSLGGENDIGTLAGGSGGVASSGSCPQGSVVTGQGGLAAPVTGLSLFGLRCHRWDAATRRWSTTSTAVIRLISGSGVANGVVQVLTSASLSGPSCSSRSQPVVLLRGRAGGIIDAAGLTCNEP